MSKRLNRNASELFVKVLTQAEECLQLESQKAANFKHKGLRGNQRAAALATFLSLHLPKFFAVGKGEARDCYDNCTGELDLLIYDHSTAAPILPSSESLIVPAEALYAVIEVKSVLSQAHLETCITAAQKVRTLKPFKKSFIAAPTDGSLDQNHYRCPYYIFAFKSDLGKDKWHIKEFQRLIETSKKIKCNLDIIDRLVVIDRGIINPQENRALLKVNSQSLFLEFYLHLMNFLTRERKRRPPIDWTAYTSSNKWTKINTSEFI